METPPPATLTAPTLDGVADGTTLYFSVVELYRDCPVSCIKFISNSSDVLTAFE